MPTSSKLLLGKAAIAEAQILKAKLASQGFEIALVHNEASCGKGCAPQVEVWAHPDDAPSIAQFLGEDRLRLLESMGYNAQLANEVFDPSSESAVCPACGTTFATTNSSCTDCGLTFDTPS